MILDRVHVRPIDPFTGLNDSRNSYIPPESTFQMLISILIMVYGFCLTSLIIVMLIYVMGQLDLRRSIFFHEAAGVTNFIVSFWDKSKEMNKVFFNYA